MGCTATRKRRERTCLITGGNSGLGFESARSLLVKGYKVIIACRNAEKAKAAVSKLKSLVQFKTDAEANDSISFQILDVSSLKSVNTFADSFLSNPKNRIHVLMCNAGIMMGAQRKVRWQLREPTKRLPL